MFKRLGIYVAVASFALLLMIQLAPYGRSHANPPVRVEPSWQGAQTRELAVRACFGCHSNQVRWPWYSNVAPVSWMIQNHVDEARDELNYSEWDRVYKEAREAAESVRDGEMPPASYVWLHPEAKLTDTERQELVQGLAATFGQGENPRGRR